MKISTTKKIIILLLISIAIFIALIHSKKASLDERTSQIINLREQTNPDISWISKEKKITVIGDRKPDLIRASKIIMKEINDIVKSEVVKIHEDPRKASIFVIGSENGHFKFNQKFKEIFEEKFGKDTYKFWNRNKELILEFNTQSPCLFMAVKSPEEFIKNENKIAIGFIAIGNMESMAEFDLVKCLREEISHAYFLIPDFELINNNESIFNSNPEQDGASNFTKLDRKIIRTIYQSDIYTINK